MNYVKVFILLNFMDSYVKVYTDLNVWVFAPFTWVFFLKYYEYG